MRRELVRSSCQPGGGDDKGWDGEVHDGVSQVGHGHNSHMDVGLIVGNLHFQQGYNVNISFSLTTPIIEEIPKEQK